MVQIRSHAQKYLTKLEKKKKKTQNVILPGLPEDVREYDSLSAREKIDQALLHLQCAHLIQAFRSDLGSLYQQLMNVTPPDLDEGGDHETGGV